MHKAKIGFTDLAPGTDRVAFAIQIDRGPESHRHVAWVLMRLKSSGTSPK